MACVLIADDDALFREMLKQVLERHGYNVLEAQDGIECVKIFKKIKVDLVILDLVMPEKEGLETIPELKKMDSDAKIIAITGGSRFNPDDFLNIAISLGAATSFKKPIDNKELIKAIEDLLM